MEKIIPGFTESTQYFEEMEKRILMMFREEIYYPMLRELGVSQLSIHNSYEIDVRFKTIQNSLSDFIRSIYSGKIYFSRGYFRGRFNSTSSRELKKLGAVWDRKQGSWKIPLSQLNMEIRSAISLSDANFLNKIAKIDQQLEKLVPEKIADLISIDKLFQMSITKTDERIQGSIKGIVVTPKLTEKQTEEIAAGYTLDLKKYITDFTKKQTLELREKIAKSTMEGMRYEGVIKDIKDSYGVSANKAKFLARQETGLMMAQLKKSRYQDAGSNEYIWTCVIANPKHPVRPDHKELDGKRFSWDTPPVTNKKTQARNNPGQDYNCRCYPRPIVKF